MKLIQSFKQLYLVLFIAILVSSTACNDVRENAAPAAAVSTAACDTAASPFGGGSGSASDPFQICSISQLQQVSTDITKNYKLMADLNLISTAFTPLGTYAVGFSGVFDGNNHMISNWSYTAANTADSAATIEADTPLVASAVHIDYAAGFFRTLESGAVVKDLTLANVSFWGRFYTGALVGKMKAGSTVQNCNATTSGAVSQVGTALTDIVIGFNDLPTGSTSGMTGGLVGRLDAGATITGSSFSGLVRGGNLMGGLVGNVYGTITNSHTSGAMKGRDGNNGGFAGNINSGGLISGSYSTATMLETSGNSGGFIGSVNAGALVTTSYYNGSMTGNSLGTGGFVGYVIGANAKVTKCYSAGTVNGAGYVGGFAGWVKTGGAIEDSYSVSTVTSSSWAGGFLGVLSDNGSGGALTRVYSAGSVTSSGGNAGDLLGDLGNFGVVTNSFADAAASANPLVNTIVGTGTPGTTPGSSSQATAVLQASAIYSGGSWDLTTVWQIATSGRYPILR